MAFRQRNPDSSPNNRQRLSISFAASEIISYDMDAFGIENISGFINRIFANFHGIARASCSLEMNRYKGYLDDVLADVSADSLSKRKLLRRLAEAREKELLERCSESIREKSHDCSFTFWLNKTNWEYLMEPGSECGEDRFYTSRGRYISSIIEEYTELDYVERERVFFRDFLDIISQAIADRRMLRIQLSTTGNVYSIYPYRIMTDPLATANYIVGYIAEGSDDSAKRPCTYRISRLRAVKEEKSRSAFLKNEEKKRLLSEIEHRGVQFLGSPETEVVVRFSREGIAHYRRRAHLRPKCMEKSDNIYTFRCTLSQAEFYFLPFGKDAEILSPKSLSDRFLGFYLDAAHKYMDEAIKQS